MARSLKRLGTQRKEKEATKRIRTQAAKSASKKQQVIVKRVLGDIKKPESEYGSVADNEEEKHGEPNQQQNKAEFDDKERDWFALEIYRLRETVAKQELRHASEVAFLRSQIEFHQEQYKNLVAQTSSDRSKYLTALTYQAKAGNTHRDAKTAHYFVAAEDNYKKFKEVVQNLDENIYDALVAQLEVMRDYELEKFVLYVRKEQFWINLVRLYYAQMAIYASIIQNSGDLNKTKVAMVKQLEHLSVVFRSKGKELLEYSDLPLAIQYIKCIPTLKAPSSQQTCLNVMRAMTIHVYGATESRMSLKFCRADPPLMELQELVTAVKNYRDFPPTKPGKDSTVMQHFGLFLTLLLLTGQRNATVRKAPFEQFYIKQGTPRFSTYATKTNKSLTYVIDKFVYDMVMTIKEQREEYFVPKIKALKIKIDSGKYPGERERHEKKLKLYERRRDHVFTFYASSVVQRTKDFKDYLKSNYPKFQNTDGFILHHIRKLVIQDAFKSGGSEGALLISQHRDIKTTRAHYLDQVLERAGKLKLAPSRSATPIMDVKFHDSDDEADIEDDSESDIEDLEQKGDDEILYNAMTTALKKEEGEEEIQMIQT